MSTADISMSYGSMSSLAHAVNEMQQDFEMLQSNLDTLVDNLEGQWQGTAQVEFATAYSKLRPKLSTISGVLKDFADAVNITAENEASTDSSTAAAMGKLSF